MHLVQIYYDIPTDDLMMTFHACFKARLIEVNEKTAIAAFNEFIKTCTYKNKDQAVYNGFWIQKKLEF